jgi:hypothetical protein
VKRSISEDGVIVFKVGLETMGIAQRNILAYLLFDAVFSSYSSSWHVTQRARSAVEKSSRIACDQSGA